MEGMGYMILQLKAYLDNELRAHEFPSVVAVGICAIIPPRKHICMQQ
jgi:hypothetical protein